jgi:hypothetical protein
VFKRHSLWHPILVLIGWFAATFWLFKRAAGAHSFAEILAASAHLDVGWYRSIAAQGYFIDPQITDGQSTVFFPLFPGLAALLIHFFSLNSLLALHIVQKLALVPMVLLTYRWSSTAGFSPKESVLALLMHPAWIFLLVPYSETVYLCCLFALLISWQQRNKWLFFVCAFLLGLCRPTGLFLIPAACLTVGYCFLQAFFSTQKPDWQAPIKLLCYGVLGSLAAFGVLALIMHVSVGDWFAFYRYRTLWNEEPSLRNVLAAMNLDYGSQAPRVLAVWVALFGSALLIRSGRVFEGMLCAVAILLPVYQGKMPDIIRFSLGAAPAWLMIAEKLKERRTLHLFFIAASCSYGVVLCYQWIARTWVG